MDVNAVIWALAGYISGSIPWGYLVGRAKGIDITKRGSGNIGGANVARNLGMGYGVLVMLLDLLKGFVPAYLAHAYAGIHYALLAAMFAIIGAVFSIFLKFRGGKGFATITGGYLALVTATGTWGPLPVMITTWFVVVLLTQMTGLANIVTIVTAIPLHALIADPLMTTYVTFAALAVLYSHRDNIVLMLQGKLEEQRFSHKGKRSITMDKV
ncbi:MAG: acyl phosphate:glycerol-3-phosphate acyltransferase [Candidatus Diapherotrites archaeon]|nr:acyl phosphate:glycerol-3-phosphate acyltransferase [Candidatus Diapherotrites archaeon]MDN5366789.1 acyl phosphate:glycerol-3-phosphate acyltransferase [Candidatus Diapherotrites archaeon]